MPLLLLECAVNEHLFCSFCSIIYVPCQFFTNHFCLAIVSTSIYIFLRYFIENSKSLLLFSLIVNLGRQLSILMKASFFVEILVLLLVLVERVREHTKTQYEYTRV
jgi:hypothetical protein